MIRHAEEVMGTVVSFALVAADEDVARRALRSACAVLHRADELFSTYRPESPLSRLRRGEISIVAAPREVREVLRLCRRAWRLSGGWFDPWAMPGGVDPTGLVKGWAAARALDRLRAAGIPAAMVNAAGDIAVHGSPRPSRPWRVGLLDPQRRNDLAGTVAVQAAIATSGTTERGAHILDPFRGRSATGVTSATVTGPELALADAFATALVAGGVRAFDVVSRVPGYQALMFADRRWTATPGLRSAVGDR